MAAPRAALACLALFSSIATAYGADKDGSFQVKPAASYASNATISSLTIGAEVYNTQQEVKSAFGKLDPNKHGVLPVLVVMQNDSSQTLRLQDMRVEYIRPDGRSVIATPAADVPYLHGPAKPRTAPPTYPIPGLGGRRKNPLDVWEIGGRAFSARMLPAGEAANGFFYFQTADHRGAKLYITGISEAATGQELFYFEIPLD
ncbi:MAG: hypothetical protein KIT09_11335 [Bryobacteraceae bacterium]|nr:hypothetical protein [Bryobacteraceae bacterium]